PPAATSDVFSRACDGPRRGSGAATGPVGGRSAGGAFEGPGDVTVRVVDDAQDLAVATGPGLVGREVVGEVELGVLVGGADEEVELVDAELVGELLDLELPGIDAVGHVSGRVGLAAVRFAAGDRLDGRDLSLHLGLLGGKAVSDADVEDVLLGGPAGGLHLVAALIQVLEGLVQAVSPAAQEQSAAGQREGGSGDRGGGGGTTEPPPGRTQGH